MFTMTAIFFLIKNFKKYEIIYLINPMPFWLLIALVSKLLWREIVFDLRTWPIRKRDILYYAMIFLDSLIIRLSSKVIFINKDIYYERWYFWLWKKKIHETLLWFELGKDQKDTISKINRLANNYAFLYTGTLSKKRELGQMIIAFSTMHNCTLYLLWNWDDEEKLKSIAWKNIIFLGHCEHKEVAKYIQWVSFWVSFIPVNEQYDLQPPLKTIEYLWFWLPVLWTRTQGNMKFINERNWVLIQNHVSVESIKNAINDIISKKFSKEEIQREASHYTRKNIVRDLCSAVSE